MLAAARYEDQATEIGIILGTGTNACIVDKVRPGPRLLTLVPACCLSSRFIFDCVCISCLLNSLLAVVCNVTRRLTTLVRLAAAQVSKQVEAGGRTSSYACNVAGSYTCSHKLLIPFHRSAS